jgi:hypothetical protein
MPGGRSASATSGEKPGIGALTPVQTQPLPVADGGAWSNLVTTSDVPVHISLLPDGRLFYWGRDKAPDNWDINGKSNTFLSDPLYFEADYTTTINTCPDPLSNCPAPTNLFCSGHSFLPDGRLLVSGGHNRPDQYPFQEGIGEPSLNIFDYRTNTWSHAQSNMPKGRWYPYNVTLANGETLVIAGSYWPGDTWVIGGQTVPHTRTNDEPDVRGLAGTVRTLTDNGTGKFPVVGYYPYISLASNGKVFIASPSAIPAVDGNNSRLLDPYATNSGNGLGVFTAVANPASPHTEGTSVMYAPDKVMMLGGINLQAGGAPTKVAETIDLSRSTPTWASVGQLAYGRHYPNATLLPDGKVLVTGGTSCAGSNNLDCGPNQTYGGAVQTPELWDPDNPSVWTKMNPTNSGVPRVYHSVALLMPDARVLVGGGGLPLATGETTAEGIPCPQSEPNFPCRKGGHKNVEYFSPPYLFNTDGTPATRPSITSAPSSIAYGQTFFVGVGNVNASDIKEVVLIRLPSVTHTYNQDQRRVVLSAPQSMGDQIALNAPANGNACPPGPYMMFLISNNLRNTPSVAKIVRVGDASINSTGQAFPATAIQNEKNSLSSTFNVNAAPGVNWVATVDSGSSAMLTINSGGSGTGFGAVRFTVSPNVNGAGVPNTARRVGKITVRVPGREAAGFDFTVYQSGNFSDVAYPTTAYFEGVHQYISNIYARGITSGCGSGMFCGTNNSTRQEAATFLTTELNPSNLPTPLTQRFTDVAPASSVGKNVEYLSRRGIIEACMGNSFCPTQPITRRDLIVWLVRAKGIDHPPTPTAETFSDVPISDPAAPFIQEAFRLGITAGCGRGKFCPNDPVSRYQMASLLVATFGW